MDQKEFLEAYQMRLETLLKNSPNKIISMIQPKLENVNFEERIMTTKYETKNWEMNDYNILHGGILATIIDTSMGMYSSVLSGGSLVTTVSLTLNFLKPIPEDCSLLVNAKAVSVGKTIISMSAEAIIQETGATAASAVGTFMVLKKPVEGQK